MLEFIQELREQGWNVKLSHRRIDIDDHAENVNESHDNQQSFLRSWAFPTWVLRDELGTVISPQGGVTEVHASKDGKEYQATAVCSLKDNYNKVTGRNKALGRLRQQMIKDGAYVSRGNS